MTNKVEFTAEHQKVIRVLSAVSTYFQNLGLKPGKIRDFEVFVSVPSEKHRDYRVVAGVKHSAKKLPLDTGEKLEKHLNEQLSFKGRKISVIANADSKLFVFVIRITSRVS